MLKSRLLDEQKIYISLNVDKLGILLWFCLNIYCTIYSNLQIAQSAGAVEYADCTSGGLDMTLNNLMVRFQ